MDTWTLPKPRRHNCTALILKHRQQQIAPAATSWILPQVASNSRSTSARSPRLRIPSLNARSASSLRHHSKAGQAPLALNAVPNEISMQSG